MDGFTNTQMQQLRSIIEDVVTEAIYKSEKAPKSVTVSEAAAIMNRSVSYIRKLIHNGELSAYKPANGVTRVSLKQIQQF